MVGTTLVGKKRTAFSTALLKRQPTVSVNTVLPTLADGWVQYVHFSARLKRKCMVSDKAGREGERFVTECAESNRCNLLLHSRVFLCTGYLGMMSDVSFTLFNNKNLSHFYNGEADRILIP
jgi:hypothetical protein